MNHAFKIKKKKKQHSNNKSKATMTKAKASVSTLIQERGFQFGRNSLRLNEFFIASFIELKILGP